MEVETIAREEKVFIWVGAVVAEHFRKPNQPCRSASLLHVEEPRL